jgi:hypothetical protein
VKIFEWRVSVVMRITFGMERRILILQLPSGLYTHIRHSRLCSLTRVVNIATRHIPLFQRACSAKPTDSKLTYSRWMHDISLRRSRNPHADLPNSSLVRKVYVKAKIVVLVQQGINSSHTRLRTLEHPIGG